MEPTPHPLTLTVEQAAKVLGIGRSTAYELVHTGAIPSLRLGRRIVVPTAKLAERLGVTVEGLHPPVDVAETCPAGAASDHNHHQAAMRPSPGASEATLF